MTVLVCTDFSTASAAGEREAAARYPGARLVLFHVVDGRLIKRMLEVTGDDAAHVRGEVFALADRRLGEVRERLASQGHRADADLVEGDPVDETLAAAARHGADVIVAGVRAGKRLGRFRTLVARQTTVPFLVIPVREA